MKLKLLVCLVALLVSNNLFSQNEHIRVKYLLKFQVDSNDRENIDQELFYLDIGAKKSNFQTESTFLKDSILASENPRALFGISKPKFRYNIIKDYGDDTQTVYHDYTAFKYKVKDCMGFEWKIVNDSSKTILGQKCKLAKSSFRGREYSAWFSTEIFVADGPYKFSGLPGLILDISDSENHYHFTAIGMQKMKSKVDYLSIEDYTLISKKQLKEFYLRVREKPSIILYNPGIRIPKEGLDKYDKTHRERNKRKNNPLELKDE